MKKYKELTKDGFCYVNLTINFVNFCSDNCIDYMEKNNEIFQFVNIRLYYNIDYNDDFAIFERIDCKVIDKKPNFIPNMFWKEFTESVKLEWLESFNFNNDFVNSFNDKLFKTKLENII